MHWLPHRSIPFSFPRIYFPIAALPCSMDREELRETWAEQNDRPAWVRANREAIHDHTDTNEAVPDGSLFEVRQWLDRYKGTVTRQLNDDSEGTDPHDEEDAETTTPDAAEEEA